MKFSDIPQIPKAYWACNFGWLYLEDQINGWMADWGVDLEPDFQRGHVWSDEQRTKYVEYVLQGGETARILVFNHPGWHAGETMGQPIQLLDGLQRLTSARMFLRNELKAFGLYRREFGGPPRRMNDADFIFRMLTLPTRADVLSFYLTMNGGGVVHSPAELARVRKLLEKEKK